MKNIIFLINLLIIFSCSETPSDAPIDSSREVQFDLNMNNAISEGLFDISIDVLTVFLDSSDEFQMVDDDDDNIFSCTIPNLIFGRTYQYQYMINEVQEELDTERTFIVYDDNNSILDYYGELNPTTLIFLVNMSYQIELGNFNPDSEVLNIAGNLNDWVGDQLEVSEDSEDVYVITITDIEVGQEIEFKFRVDEEGWETPNPDVSSCVDDTFGGNNRYHVVEQGENILEYWYSDDSGN